MADFVDHFRYFRVARLAASGFRFLVTLLEHSFERRVRRDGDHKVLKALRQVDSLLHFLVHLAGKLFSDDLVARLVVRAEIDEQIQRSLVVRVLGHQVGAVDRGFDADALLKRDHHIGIEEGIEFCTDTAYTVKVREVLVVLDVELCFL